MRHNYQWPGGFGGISLRCSGKDLFHPPCLLAECERLKEQPLLLQHYREKVQGPREHKPDCTTCVNASTHSQHRSANVLSFRMRRSAANYRCGLSCRRSSPLSLPGTGDIIPGRGETICVRRWFLVLKYENLKTPQLERAYSRCRPCTLCSGHRLDHCCGKWDQSLLPVRSDALEFLPRGQKAEVHVGAGRPCRIVQGRAEGLILLCLEAAPERAVCGRLLLLSRVLPPPRVEASPWQCEDVYYFSYRFITEQPSCEPGNYLSVSFMEYYPPHSQRRKHSDDAWAFSKLSQNIKAATVVQKRRSFSTHGADVVPTHKRMLQWLCCKPARETIRSMA